MSVIMLVIIGAGAGYLATRFMRVHTDVVTTVVIGIFGALVGGFVLRTLISIMGALAGFVGAVLGAMVLIWLWQRYGPRR